MPELQWKDNPTSAWHNGVKVTEILFSPYSERYHIPYPYPIFRLPESEFYLKGWEDLDKAKSEIQQQFDTFYNKYKPLFEGEKT